MISKRYNAQMGNYLAKLAQEQNNLGTWQESIIKEYKTKQTNADRIRSMTDEELAEWFIKVQDDVADYYDSGHAVAPDLPTMKESWLDWLKEEYADG